MKCTFRFRLNHLASVWYVVLALALQSYLLYLAFERYRLYTEMKWPLGQYPRQWLTAYICLLGACIPLMVLFAAFALFKSGNLAGDNEQLGGRVERVIEIRSPRDGKKKESSRKRRRKEPCCYRCCHLLRSVWQHSPPLPQSIHIAMALAQLVAQQLMLTQLYRFGFINSGDFLNTELDFAYQRSRQLATNLPMGDTRLQGFRITSEELTDSPLAPNLLPILMHARLFGVPLEFVNLLIALFAYSVAYPSVFWRASRAFACCFSAYLLIHCASLIWTYLQWTVLFRVQETNYYSPRPVGIGQHLWPLRPDWIVLFDPLSLLATFLVTMALMQAAPVALYAYGFSKYVQCQRHHYAETIGEPGIGSDPSPPSSRGYITANGTFPPSSSRENSASSGSTMMKRGNVLNVSSRRRRDDDGESHCCEGYTSHVVAIVLLILIVLAKAPSLYAMMLLYQVKSGWLLQHEEKPLILTCIILDIVYLFSWIVLWLFLTLKRDWNFRVWFGVEELISLQDGHRMPIAGGGGRRTASDLKNALLLMHGRRMYVTDDPLAKSSIWRHATKSGAQQRKCCSQRGCDKSSAVCLYHSAGSPALSYARKGGSQVEQYAPLAAPPYQNRQQQIGLDGNEGGFVVNTFGTLQRGSSADAGDYGGMMSSAGYYSSSGHRSTITQPQPSYMRLDTVRPPQAAYYSSSTLGRQSTRGAGGGSVLASPSPHMQNRHSHSNVAQSRAPANVYAPSTLTRTGQTHAYSPHNNLYGGCYAPAVMPSASQQYAGGMHSKMVRPSPQLGGRPHHPNVLIGGPIGTVTPNSYTKSDVYGTVYSSTYVHATGGCQPQEPRWHHQPQSSQHSDVASDTTSCPNSTAETGKDANRSNANGPPSGGRRTTTAGFTTYDGLVVRSGLGGPCSGSDTLTRHHPILTATMVRTKETAKKEATPANSNGPLTAATVAAIAPTPAPKPAILVPNSTISDREVDSSMALNGGVAGRGEEDASTPSAAYSVRELEEMVNEFATSVV